MALTSSSLVSILNDTNQQQQQQQSFDAAFDAPSYMRVADIYDRANRNTGREVAESSVLEDIPKFIASSIISGGAQLYNVLPTVGNLLGGDFELAEIDEVFQAIDDDLSKFYEQHQQSVDTVGFILSTLVPGLAGIKGIRMLQSAGVTRLEAAMKSGRIGETTGKALGLLAPNRERALKTAISELTNSNSTQILINRNFLKSMSAGFGQNIIEATAFETAVAVTLSQSPVLEDHDLGDFATNIAFGGLVFGAIGGVVDATRGVFAAKKAIRTAGEEAFPFIHYNTPLAGTPVEDRIAIYWDQLANDIPVAGAGLSAERQSFLNAAATKKKDALLHNVRKDLGELAGGDQETAEQMFTLLQLGKKNDGVQNIMGLTSVAKLGDNVPMANKLDKALKRQAAGKGRLVGTKGGPGDDEIIMNTRVGYAKNHGEGMGDIVDVSPLRITVADSLLKGEKIVVDGKGVRVVKSKSVAGVKTETTKNNWQFSHDTTANPWSIISASPMEANARHLWAQKLPPLNTLFKPAKGSELIIPVIRESDIPMLEKLLREFDQNAKHIIKMEDGSSQAFAAVDDYFEFLIKQKEKWSNRLNKKSNKGVFLGNKEDVVTKLRHITGINFAFRTLPEGTIGRRVIGKGLGTQIFLNTDYLLKKPLHELIGTLKHEEGHTIFDALLKIGGLPTNKAKDILAEATKLSAKRRSPVGQTAEHKKYLAQEHELMADMFAYLSQFPQKALKEAPAFHGEFGHLLRPIPKTVIDKYFARAEQLTQEEIASMVNVRNSYLSGTMSNQASRDILAMQSYAEDYTAELVKRGLRKDTDSIVDVSLQPRHLKLTYDTTPIQDVDGNVLRGMNLIKENQNLTKQEADRVTTQVLGADAQKLVDTLDRHIMGANSLGSGANFTSAASSNPGSLGSFVEYTGQIVTGIINKFKTQTRETLEPALYKLAQNKNATVEWGVLNTRLRALEDHYVLNETGDALIPTVFDDFNKATLAGKNPAHPVLKSVDAPELIPLVNTEVRELAAAHIATNGKRLDSARLIHTAEGAQFRTNPNEFYPTPINPRDFPFFAIVKDASITGAGRTTTLNANSSEQLEQMITQLRSDPTLVIRTKGETEKYFKARGEFDTDLALNENYLDATIARRGVSSPALPPTDAEKITSELLTWHMSAEAALVRGTVKLKYNKQFAELHAMGESYTNVATSRYNNASLLKHADERIENPYAGYERTALGLRNNADYPLWTGLNRQVDAVMSRMYNKLSGVLENARTPEQLDELNTILAEHGYKGARYTPEMEILANHTAPVGALNSFVSKANAILATVVLRLDTLNAVNNTVGHHVLLGTETRSIIRAIKAGDANAIGDLSKLMDIAVPGTDNVIASPTKLIARAIRNFGSDDKALMEFFREHGFITTISQQYKQTLDHLTLSGKESVGQLEGKIAAIQHNIRVAADTGEKWTGNRLAEEFNRFIAAHVMKDISDVAVKHGIMTGKEQLAYINTFVNRTQGNYLAAQRPMMFQGPIGQSIGLFQTYQFNLMQQLLRHIGEGPAKDSMTLLGLQGTIYGMNGLPGFNAINTHVIGNASGNKQHRDFYDVTYGAAGKTAGDWLTYGVASNMLLDPDLKINLYVRGDINPRHVTLVPLDPASVPIVQATGKFLANLKKTSQKLSAGGDVWQTFLQGIEHNGVSRPLAGLAQTLQGLDNGQAQSYSTSKRGNVIASNDLLSLANLARLVGGKPLDEAVAIDAAFRFKSYALEDSHRRNLLGQAIKTTMIAGGDPSVEQVESFSQRYAELGGSMTEYNKWMMQLYKTANTSQANKLSQNLKSPFNQSMQRIMGGHELKDFIKPITALE